MNSESDLQEMSRHLVSLPPEEFAAAMLQWMFLQFLSKKGLPEMTVVLPDSVFYIGTGEPVERMRVSRDALDKKIAEESGLP